MNVAWLHLSEYPRVPVDLCEDDQVGRGQGDPGVGGSDAQ